MSKGVDMTDTPQYVAVWSKVHGDVTPFWGCYDHAELTCKGCSDWDGRGFLWYCPDGAGSRPIPPANSYAWLSDVLDGLRAQKIGIMLQHNGVWLRWQNDKGHGEVGSTNPTLNEALLQACLKYMEAKHE